MPKKIHHQDCNISGLIAAVEPIIGFEIESLTNEEINLLSKDELDIIRFEINDTLRKDTFRIDNEVFDSIVPVQWGFWDIGNFVAFRNIASLSLIYRRVLMPVGDINTDILEISNVPLRKQSDKRAVGKRAKTKYFLAALRRYAPLLRNGSLFPFCYDIYNTESLNWLAGKVAKKVDFSTIDYLPSDIDPVRDELFSRKRKQSHLEGNFYSLYIKLFQIRKWGAIPSYSDQYSWNLWKILTENNATASLRSKNCEISSVLTNITLPGIRKMKLEDIAALHRDSESFAQWRNRFSSVMRTVVSRVESGDNPQRSLEEEIFPLGDYVRGIENELSKSSLRSILQSSSLTVGIGLSAAFLSELAINQLKFDSTLAKDTIKIGAAGIASALWPLLFSKPKSEKTIVANIFNTVFQKV